MRNVLILATVVWFVIAWNIFDPLSTIMFEPVKIPDAKYYEQIDELNSKFYPLMVGPPACAWILWCLERNVWSRNIGMIIVTIVALGVTLAMLERIRS